ncbi:hypothetical protein CS369_14790 [Candidatus Symbiopectobacterium sp. 'North America']|nr:hypothetical protein [Candidatus Symbiopectobacterium sp. 'North America']
MRWLHSLTRITYLSKLIGTHSLAAFLQRELFRVYINQTAQRQPRRHSIGTYPMLTISTCSHYDRVVLK